MPSILTISGPAAEPLTLAQAKAHLRIDPDDTTHDVDLPGMITAVRQACEGELQRTLIRTGYEFVSDVFTEALRLDRPPVIEVESIRYVDETGTLRTLDPQDYFVDNVSEPGYVVPAYSKGWPCTRRQPNAVRVRYTAGYGDDGSAVPGPILQWMKLHLGSYFRSREATVIGQPVAQLPYASGLLDQYRIRVF